MASSYVNDLRLNEMATGDQSGTWGNTTNTNLELIAEAFGFGTEGITTNADTHTSTIADGATDPVRAHYVKYTGTLDSACTITIAPNTVNRFHIIENGTSGSQNIIISQGSGANVTIAAGTAKAVYLDGAGSGAAVTDAFSHLSVVDLTVDDDLIVSDDVTLKSDSAVLGFGADTDTTLTHTDGTGLTLNSTNKLTFGDADSFIQQSTDGTLKIDGEGIIDLNASTAVQVSHDMKLQSDGAVVGFGVDNEITLTHSSDNGLFLKNTNTSDGSFPTFELQTGETAVELNDVLGSLSWKAPDESGGTDAITQAAFILARAGADFTDSVNDTKLQFGVGLSGGASTKLTLDSDGDLIIEDGDLVLGTGQHGIDFASAAAGTGDSNAAETSTATVLDDYEEGTFTPVSNSVTAGSGSITAVGMYVKVGNLVNISVRFTPSGGQTNAHQFGMYLPFKAGTTESSGSFNTWIGGVSFSTAQGTGLNRHFRLGGDSNFGETKVQSSTSISNTTGNGETGNFSFDMSITYRTID